MSRQLLMDLGSKTNPFKYETPNKHVTLQTASLNNSFTNFRVFGWFGPTAIITPRVINEGAGVADLIEKIF
jgi:hypothetical protein